MKLFWHHWANQFSSHITIFSVKVKIWWRAYLSRSDNSQNVLMTHEKNETSMTNFFYAMSNLTLWLYLRVNFQHFSSNICNIRISTPTKFSSMKTQAKTSQRDWEKSMHSIFIFYILCLIVSRKQVTENLYIVMCQIQA